MNVVDRVSERPPSKWRDFKVKCSIFLALGAIVGTASALLIFPRARDADWKSASFSVDEPGWIAASYYYTRLLQEGDFDWRKWDCPECGKGSSYGSLNMHVGEWLIGFPLTTDPQINSRPFLKYYDVDASLEDNLRAGQIPPADILTRARFTPALFGVLCCLLAFSLGFWVYNPWVGMLSGLLVMLNPVLLKLAGQAMTDTFYNFFLLSGCLTLVAIYKTNNKRLIRLLISLSGILGGLACSVKVTGILVAGCVFMLAACWLFYARKFGKKEIALTLATYSLFSLLTVYLLNPLFWPSVRQFRMEATFDELHTVFGQVAATKRPPWNGRDAFVADTRYPQLHNLSHVLEFPLLFLRWNNMMQRQSSRGWEGWKGPRIVSLNATLLTLATPLIIPLGTTPAWRFIASAIEIVFFCSGLFYVFQKHRAALRSRDDASFVPLMYFLVNYFFIALFMRLNWDRYYLPTIIALQIVTAVGIYALSTKAYLLLARGRSIG